MGTTSGAQNRSSAFLSEMMMHTDTVSREPKQYIQLYFIDDQKDVRALHAQSAARHRQSMFTDFERHAMSEEVARSVPNEDVNKAISDLERLEPHGASPALLSCFRGPFGALRLSQTEKLEPIHMDTEVAPLLSRDWDDELEEILREDEFTFDNPAVQEIGQNESWMPQEPNLSQLENTSFGSIESQLQPQINIYGTNIESWTLLSHYKGQIVPLISPLRRGQETPWISLVIPCAVTTLGELTLNGQVNNARLALLNAVWSTSAFHLSNNTSWSGNWKASGEMYLQRAEYYFQKCMEETCLSTSKINKYKEILMAILSLSNAFMFRGDPAKRRAYLIQTERFIRVNGLSKPKLSSKKRALHHCYAFMRIIAETTCVADNLNVQLIQSSGGAIGDTIYEGDFRILPNLAFSSDAMTEEKDPEMGERDLHLAIPGRWSSTLFPTVYGVDELFLMLLSQVIRLANERDLSTLHKGEQQERLSLREFWIRAKAIEKAINSLISSSATIGTHAQETESSLKENSTAAQAMSISLLIFFYRRIYEVDPAILQCKVKIMRTYLTQIQQEEIISNESSSAALIWPAFIAACEAVEPDLQRFFSSWFDYCFATTALVYASAAKQVFEAIWDRRSNQGIYGEAYSWPDILREGKIKFTCV